MNRPTCHNYKSHAQADVSTTEYAIVVYQRDKLVPVTTAWRVLRLRMEEWPPIWREATNKLNNSRGQPTRGGPPAWGLGDVLTTPPLENPC